MYVPKILLSIRECESQHNYRGNSWSCQSPCVSTTAAVVATLVAVVVVAPDSYLPSSRYPPSIPSSRTLNAWNCFKWEFKQQLLHTSLLWAWWRFGGPTETVSFYHFFHKMYEFITTDIAFFVWWNRSRFKMRATYMYWNWQIIPTWDPIVNALCESCNFLMTFKGSQHYQYIKINLYLEMNMSDLLFLCTLRWNIVPTKMLPIIVISHTYVLKASKLNQYCTSS